MYNYTCIRNGFFSIQFLLQETLQLFTSAHHSALTSLSSLHSQLSSSRKHLTSLTAAQLTAHHCSEEMGRPLPLVANELSGPLTLVTSEMSGPLPLVTSRPETKTVSRPGLGRTRSEEVFIALKYVSCSMIIIIIICDKSFK